MPPLFAPFCASGRGLPCEVGDELFDPFVVEEDRHPAGAEEDCHSIAKDQRPRMVNLEPRAAPEHDREGPERRALLECGKGLVEMVRSHRWHPTQDKATPVSYRARERLHSPPQEPRPGPVSQPGPNLVARREQRLLLAELLIRRRAAHPGRIHANPTRTAAATKLKQMIPMAMFLASGLICSASRLKESCVCGSTFNFQ